MQLISTNLFPVPIANTKAGSTKHDLRFGLKYCPSMDLIAVFPQAVPSDQHGNTKAEIPVHSNIYTEDNEGLYVDLYRLNGQKVFTINVDNENGAIGISDVAWRNDGVILAIATTDNKIRMLNSFSGKVVHNFSSLTETSTLTLTSIAVPQSPSGKRKSTGKDVAPKKRRCIPTSLHYSTHFFDPKTATEKLETEKQESGITTDTLLGLNADIDDLLKLGGDLPRELANIDVESFLPKLSTLPPTGAGEDDVFSTRISIDAMFHPAKQTVRSTSTDVLTITQDDAHLHIRIFDSFEVGDVDLNHALDLPPGCRFGQVKNIVTHPFLDKIYCIIEEHDDGSAARHTRSHGAVETQNTPLHLLSLDLRFLQQSQLTLPILAAKATQLYNLIRYLRQIETHLAREIKTAFDLPARFIRNLDEDLKEQDGDGSTFETSAYHVLLTGEVYGKFKEWLVEQLGDRGVKRWEKAVSECLDLVRRLVSENWNPAVERAGVVVSRLSGLAAANSVFGIEKKAIEGLRDTLDVMGILGEDLLKEVSTEIEGFNAFVKWLKREVEMAGLEDTSEKLDEMREGSDHSEVRKAIQYVSERMHNTSVKKYIRDDTPGVNDLFDVGEVGLYDSYKKERQNGREKSPPAMKSLTNRLTEQCSRLFQQVARQLRENVVVQHVRQITRDENSWGYPAGDMMKSRIVWESAGPVLHTIGKHSITRNGIIWIKQQLEQSTIQGTLLHVEEEWEVLDVNIADDQQAMILAGNSEKVFILRMHMQPGTCELKVRHAFDEPADEFIKAGLRPWKLEINGRRGRRTVTVLDEQGRGYAVFDLDSTGKDEGMHHSMAE